LIERRDRLGPMSRPRKSNRRISGNRVVQTNASQTRQQFDGLLRLA
jgi:hypothetical protein